MNFISSARLLLFHGKHTGMYTLHAYLAHALLLRLLLLLPLPSPTFLRKTSPLFSYKLTIQTLKHTLYIKFQDEYIQQTGHTATTTCPEQSADTDPTSYEQLAVQVYYSYRIKVFADS